MAALPLIYILGILPSWWAISGMLLAHFQGKYPEIAQKDFREDLGVSVLVGAGYSLLWPVGLPVAYCLTGFAEHGIWKRPKLHPDPTVN